MALIFRTSLSDILNGTNKADIIYGAEGADTIHGLQGDDKVVGEKESLIYTNIAGVITTPPPVAFSGDFLYGDQGNDTLIGDVVSVVFKVVAGPEVSQTLGGALPSSPIMLTFGNDSLDGGVGNDTLVGDVDSILLSATGGSTSADEPKGSAIGTLQYITLNMGSDTLNGGSGADMLYGDTRFLILEAIGGTANDPTAGNQSAEGRIQGINYLAGADTIYGGSENDVIIGDIDTLSLLAQGGEALGTGDAAIGRIRPVTNLTDTIVLTMGSDQLWGDQGEDILYGDIHNLAVSSIGGTVDGGLASQSQLVGITITMGADELHGGEENDTLYGDIGYSSILGEGGLSSSAGASTAAFIQPATFPDFLADVFNMGSDQLYGDNGDDHLVGDIGTLLIQSVAGFADNGSANAQVIPTLFMGQDTLDGGNGNDLLVGDIENLSYFSQGGTLTESGSLANAFLGSNLTLGADFLMGGNGDDVLYGDVNTLSILNIGGNNSSMITTATASAGSAGSFPSIILMGSDDLQGNSGNDIIYGDLGTMSIFLQGGINSGASTGSTAALGALNNSTFTMGSDNLDGGSGNDILYGDIETFSATTTSGTGFGTISIIDTTTIILGSDTLIGGSGNDVLVGDIADPTQFAGYLNAPLGLTEPGINQMIFGNDTFEFSLGGMNGDDVIKDMNVGAASTPTTTVTNTDDTLKFTDVMDVNHDSVVDFHDVDVQSIFSADGASHLVMSFAEGGSITFENIAYTGQLSVLDITPNVVVV